MKQEDGEQQIFTKFHDISVNESVGYEDKIAGAVLLLVDVLPGSLRSARHHRLGRGSTVVVRRGTGPATTERAFSSGARRVSAVNATTTRWRVRTPVTVLLSVSATARADRARKLRTYTVLLLRRRNTRDGVRGQVRCAIGTYYYAATSSHGHQ